jgi:anti-sigma B factor antagonist
MEEDFMAIKVNVTKDVAVLSVSGKLMGGRETWAVHEKVKSLIADGITRIVINLAKVKWLNSQGLGMLMASHTSLKNAKGDLKIAGATEKVNSLFMITKLITVFDTYETTDAAVAEFNTQAK